MNQTIHVLNNVVQDLIIIKLVYKNVLNNNHIIKKIIANLLVQVIMLTQKKEMYVIINVLIMFWVRINIV